MKRWLALLLMAVLTLTAGTALADLVWSDEEPVMLLDEADDRVYPLIYYTNLSETGAQDLVVDLGLIPSNMLISKACTISASVQDPADNGKPFFIQNQILKVEGPGGYVYPISYNNWNASDVPVYFSPDTGWGADKPVHGFVYDANPSDDSTFRYVFKTTENTRNLPEGEYTATFALVHPDPELHTFVGSLTIKFTVGPHGPECKNLVYDKTKETDTHHFRVCKDCGKGELLEHDWSEATCTSKPKCNECGKENLKASMLPHTANDAKCTEDVICTVCSENLTETEERKGKHEYDFEKWVPCIGDKGKTHHGHPCKWCGETYQPQDEEHKYEFGNSYDADCDGCGYVREISPSKVTIVKQLSGITASELPDGTEFVFDILDGSKNSTEFPSVKITKEDLLNGDNSVEVVVDRQMSLIVGERIDSARVAGYICETVMLPYYGMVDRDEEYVYSWENPIGAGDVLDLVFENAYTKEGVTPSPDDPELPDTEIKVIVTKKLAGIDASDLPDGTVFEFSFIDLSDNSLNGEELGRVGFSKSDLMAASNGSTKEVPIRVPGGKGLVRIGVTENGTERVSGYHVNVNMECSGAAEPGDKPEDRGDGSIPVGSFEIELRDDVIVDGDLPFQPIARTAGPVVEIVITNTFTPMDPSQEVPSDINLPKTGDESNLALWAGMMLVSGAAGMVLLRKKREA